MYHKHSHGKVLLLNQRLSAYQQCCAKYTGRTEGRFILEAKPYIHVLIDDNHNKNTIIIFIVTNNNNWHSVVGTTAL